MDMDRSKTQIICSEQIVKNMKKKRSMAPKVLEPKNVYKTYFLIFRQKIFFNIFLGNIPIFIQFSKIFVKIESKSGCLLFPRKH